MKPIWNDPPSIEQLNQLCQNSLISHLQIHFTEMGDDFLEGSFIVQPFHLQPYGIVHGGAFAILAETVANTAATLVLDINSDYCVGINLTIHHIKSTSSGIVIARATADHIGQSTQVWSIRIYDKQNQTLSMARLTVANLKKAHSNPSKVCGSERSQEKLKSKLT